MVFLGFSIILWIAFIALSQVKRKSNENRFFEGALALMVIPFVVIDVMYNFVYGTVIFLQFPSIKRPTLTARLKHILETDKGWRYKVASFICRRMIEPWEQGHCSLKK